MNGPIALCALFMVGMAVSLRFAPPGSCDTPKERIAEDACALTPPQPEDRPPPSIQTSVQVVAVKQNVVRLGIDAPEHIAVFREELLERGAFSTDNANSAPRPQQDNATHLLNNLLNVNTVGLALLRRQLALGQTGEMSCTLERMESNLRKIQQRVECTSAEPPSAGHLAKRRALVVEDDRNECELLAGFLRLAGLHVNTAGDGAAALDHLQSQGKSDFLLMDMLMPGCDGPTTVRAIRRNPEYAGLHIYGVTGAAVEQFDLDEGPAGVDQWFRKPLNPEMLLHELRCAPASSSQRE